MRKIEKQTDPSIEQRKEWKKSFYNFLLGKKSKANEENKHYSNKLVPKTAQVYVNILEEEIIPAYYRSIEPFDVTMLTDFTNRKDVLINGIERGGAVEAWEPIYTTISIFQDIMDHTTKQPRVVTAAVIKFLKFIESILVSQISCCGISLINKIRDYHKNLTDYIENSKLWSEATEKEQESLQLNN